MWQLSICMPASCIIKNKIQILDDLQGKIIITSSSRAFHCKNWAWKRVCPTCCRTRHFFNNSNTDEDIATKFEQEYVRCVRNGKECVCSVPNCCDMEQRSASQAGSVASATHCFTVTVARSLTVMTWNPRTQHSTRWPIFR